MQSNGPAIRAIRERSRLSLTDLAAATGIDKSTLSKIEGGSRKATVGQVGLIADALAVSVIAIINAPTAA